jgi:peptidoglycan/LPS O-acetylase OafA/YrhL
LAPVHRFSLLDPLRALAVLWVFGAHSGVGVKWHDTWPTVGAIITFADSLLPVSMFFAISGFGIAGAVRVAKAQSQGGIAFFARRFRRIYPPFWVSVAVGAAVPFVIEALSWAKTGHFAAPSTANLSYQYLTFGPWEWLSHLSLLQIFAVVPGAHELSFKFTRLNAVYWTLALEVEFYVVVALALACGRHTYRVLAAVTAISLMVVLFADWEMTGIFLTHWPKFALGIWLYELFDRTARPARLPDTYRLAVGLSVVTVLVGGVVVAARTGFRPSHWELLVALTLILVAVDALDATYTRLKNTGIAPVRWAFGLASALGLMAYSIYLVHARVQLLSEQLVRQVLPHGVVQDMASHALTVALCVPFYLLVERPFAARAAAKAVRPQSAATGAIPSAS